MAGLLMQDEDLVGRCGLYCGVCTIYRAHKDDGEYPMRVVNYFKCPKIEAEL